MCFEQLMSHIVLGFCLFCFVLYTSVVMHESWLLINKFVNSSFIKGLINTCKLVVSRDLYYLERY